MTIAYEKLEVYQLSLECVEFGLAAVGKIPKGYSDLSSQLKRALLSVCLNIAEGAGKSGYSDKKRYYETAKGSAMESAAIFDIMYRINGIDLKQYQGIKSLLQRVISMLSRLSFFSHFRGDSILN